MTQTAKPKRLDYREIALEDLSEHLPGVAVAHMQNPTTYEVRLDGETVYRSTDYQKALARSECAAKLKAAREGVVALRLILPMLRTAVEAGCDVPGFDPDEHRGVKAGRTALAAYDAATGGGEA